MKSLNNLPYLIRASFTSMCSGFLLCWSGGPSLLYGSPMDNGLSTILKRPFFPLQLTLTPELKRKRERKKRKGGGNKETRTDGRKEGQRKKGGREGMAVRKVPWACYPTAWVHLPIPASRPVYVTVALKQVRLAGVAHVLGVSSGWFLKILTSGGKWDLQFRWNWVFSALLQISIHIFLSIFLSLSNV